MWGCASGVGGDPGVTAVANRILTCLRYMGLFGAGVVLVLKTEIHLWIWALQSGRAAEIKVVKQISCFLQCQCSPRASVYIEIDL